MEKHKWNNDGDIFLVELGEITTRFNDEGIHQDIKLSVNGITLYKSSWGIEHFLEVFTDPNEDLMFGIQKINGQITYINKEEENAIIYKRMTVEETNNFMKWLFFCKLPKTEQRKLKLKQWKERQSD